MKTKFLFIASLFTITFFISCDSNDKTDNTENGVATNEQITADTKIDAAIDDVSNIAENQYSIKENITNKSTTQPQSILPACATITWAFINDTFTGSIDFGTEGCTLENGNVLKGKITLSFSGNFGSAEQTISYTFDNFYHNGKLIQGSKTMTRTQISTELLATIHPVYTFALDMTVTFEDGSVYTRTGNRVKEFVEGYDTFGEWNDNVFLVTGSETTSKPNGDSWSSTIQTPLRYEVACKKPFPVSGTVLKVKNGVETLVDYGNGECDNLATATVTGEIAVTIELKK